MEKIIERIKHIRKELKLSQEEFATSLNLKRNSISLIETGKRKPSERTLNDICEKLNINQLWLKTGEGSMYKTIDNSLENLTARLLDDLDDGLGKHSEFKRWLITKTMTLPDSHLDTIKALLLDIAAEEIENLDQKKD